MKKIILTSLLAAGFAGTLVAQTVYEGFDYTGAADFDGESGGTGFTGAWSISGGSPTVTAGYNASSLDNTANPFTPIGGSGENDNLTATVDRSLAAASQINMGATGDRYFSFLINFPQTAGAGTGILFTGISGQEVSATFKLDGGVMKARAVAGGSTQAFSSGSFSLATTYFVAGKISSVASGNDTIALSVYQSSAPSATEPVSWDVTSTGAALTGTLTGVSLRHDGVNNDGNPTAFDEIRMGTSWAAVTAVPEPSTYALLAGCLALASVMVRRRRS